jgi:methylmalonyl-CoA/ethylmalonyl-CoA epimerase
MVERDELFLGVADKINVNPHGLIDEVIIEDSLRLTESHHGAQGEQDEGDDPFHGIVTFRADNILRSSRLFFNGKIIDISSLQVIYSGRQIRSLDARNLVTKAQSNSWRRLIMGKRFALMVLSGLLAAGHFYAQESGAKNNILGANAVTQIGIVVKDIEKTSKAYAELLGVEVPKWEITDPVEKSHTQYRGQPSKARAKLAFFQLDNIVIELIEPVGGPTTWQEFLDTKGEGVHHIAFEIKGMDKKIADLKAVGIPLIQQGDYTGGCYSYLDGVPKLGVILELLENFPEKE